MNGSGAALESDTVGFQTLEISSQTNSVATNVEEEADASFIMVTVDYLGRRFISFLFFNILYMVFSSSLRSIH